MGLSLALSAARANDMLQITETGENFTDLAVTLNGVHVGGVALGGAADNWQIQLLFTGFIFNLSVIGQTAFIPEPENPSLFNEIFIPSTTFIFWGSDFPLTGVGGTNPFTFSDAGIGPTGAPFDLVLSDAPARSVPDASSTLSLLGLSLAALAYFGRMPKAAA